jgi:hypothetical protein
LLLLDFWDLMTALAEFLVAVGVEVLRFKFFIRCEDGTAAVADDFLPIDGVLLMSVWPCS